MQKIKEIVNNKRRVAPKSFAFLILTPIAGILSVGLSFLYFYQTLFKFPDCIFKLTTGVPCPSCGLTRSINAFIRLKFLLSFNFHPLPILAFLYVLAVWINSFINVFIRKTDKKIPLPFLWYYSILGIVLLFWVIEVVKTLLS